MKFFSNNLKYLIEQSGKSRAAISEALGYSGHSRISNYTTGQSSPRTDDLVNIAKYFDVSVEDLTNIDLQSRPFVKEPEGKYDSKNPNIIPLIPMEAMAGYAAGNYELSLDSERYVVPDFKNKADFLIRISGTSMSPKYFNGDIVACKKIPTKTFLQWGKVYVLDTIQGVLCKRVWPAEKEGYIICRSDNFEKYPDFEIAWKEVRALAIVVGTIRLE